MIPKESKSLSTGRLKRSPGSYAFQRVRRRDRQQMKTLVLRDEGCRSIRCASIMGTDPSSPGAGEGRARPQFRHHRSRADRRGSDRIDRNRLSVAKLAPQVFLTERDPGKDVRREVAACTMRPTSAFDEAHGFHMNRHYLSWRNCDRVVASHHRVLLVRARICYFHQRSALKEFGYRMRSRILDPAKPY